jgi:hypothetical protein
VLKAVHANRVVVPVTPEARLFSLTGRLAPNTTRAIGRWIDRLASTPRGD